MEGVYLNIGALVYKKLGKYLGAETPVEYGIYQRYHRKKYSMYQTGHPKEKVLCRRLKFYTPTNPRTVLQQANRNKFANAMSAWQALTTEQKKVWNDKAQKLPMRGYNLFIKNFMLVV